MGNEEFKSKSRGDIPYTALTIFAIIAVLSATAYITFNTLTQPSAKVVPPLLETSVIPSPSSAGAAGANASPTASPSPAQSLSPASSLAPSLAPWPSVAVAACSGEDVCLSEKPFYCKEGRKTSNCAKCGCPSGTICGKGGVGYPCECIPASLSIENCTLTGFGGNLTPVKASPSPSPSPTPPPCNASHYATRYGSNALTPPPDEAFLANLSAAYAAVFGKNVSWIHPDAYLWVWRDDSSGAQTELFVYKGFYRNWIEGYAESKITANQSKCVKTQALFNPTVSSPPWTYYFQQNCWNWAFLVHFKIKDFALGSASVNRGHWLATRVADACPP
ncbi:MAG: hypothetical protein QW343_01445 [Candidatus Norongarragalinales archaeon]